MLNNKAVVLLSTVLILLTIALIGASLVSFFSLVNVAARTTAEEKKAFYLAEAGIAHGINLIRNKVEILDFDDSTFGPISLGEGTYEIHIDPGQALITSTGEVGTVKKTLQLQYSAL